MPKTRNRGKKSLKNRFFIFNTHHALHQTSKAVQLCLTITLFFLLTTNHVFAGTTPPTTTATKTPLLPDGDNGWYTQPVSIEFTATDLESGVKEIYYKIDDGAWQIDTFSNTLNLAPNASFETAGATISGLDSWEATLVDADSTYSQDTTNFLTGYETSSAKITTTNSPGIWHGINNYKEFAVTTPFDNMTASVWIKTENATETAFFKVYLLSKDALDNEVITELAQSATLTGTTDWTKLTLNFISADTTAYGVYVDIGLTGNGTIWADSVSISTALMPATASIVVGSDGNHTVYYYSTDWAGNIESQHSTSFKIDQVAPGNWENSGAYRFFWGEDDELWVYTDVEDETSGLSTFSDKLQYKTDNNDEFGYYDNLRSCSSTWHSESWFSPLITVWPWPGVKQATLLTPKIDFCNDNWNVCKIVRFFSIDMAGNTSTKDYCINGPWIRIRGEAMVRANHNIDMLSEADGDNTDGLIEAGGPFIGYFSSTRDWEVTNSHTPTTYDYQELWDMSGSKDAITGNLPTSSGLYVSNSSYTIDTTSLPADYATEDFDQVIFVNGDLQILTDIDISDTSTVLFVVNGDIEIEKTVVTVEGAIFAEGDFYTAYNIEEGDSTETLDFYGLYAADEFFFQRTLQGTNNSDTPSETFQYEAKYAVKLKDYFGRNTVTWLSEN